jgi:uncharacterized phage protein (TIGR02218 family)
MVPRSSRGASTGVMLRNASSSFVDQLVKSAVQAERLLPSCSAVLGDGACGFDVETAGYFSDTGFVDVDDARVFTFAGLNGFQERWFERGVMLVTSGAAAGLSGIIKNDLVIDGSRVIELWQSLKVDLSASDTVRLFAGCDKRTTSCKAKFGNFLNFQGFPDIPGEDWLMSYPSSASVNTGGSLSRSGQ